MRGIPVLDGFDLRGDIYLDKRTEVATPDDLIKLPEEDYPDGFIVYVKAISRYFQFDRRFLSTPESGRWRMLNTIARRPPYVNENEHVLYL